jgi:hypothetical protein
MKSSFNFFDAEMYKLNDNSKLVISEKDKIGLTLEEFKIQFA